MSNFSFSYSVFKRLVSQGHQKVSLCGSGLRKREKEKALLFVTCSETDLGALFTNHSLERSLSYSPDFAIVGSI